MLRRLKRFHVLFNEIHAPMLVGAAFNMWIGVHQGGYSVTEELPIFLGIFALPTMIAALV